MTIARAGGRFELPAVLEYRLRWDSEMTRQSFNFGFIDGGLREEMHLGR
jgi:hypothetical protein